MNRDEFLKVYWKQYRLLERDLLQTDENVQLIAIIIIHFQANI